MLTDLHGDISILEEPPSWIDYERKAETVTTSPRSPDGCYVDCQGLRLMSVSDKLMGYIGLGDGQYWQFVSPPSFRGWNTERAGFGSWVFPVRGQKSMLMKQIQYSLPICTILQIQFQQYSRVIIISTSMYAI